MLKASGKHKKIKNGTKSYSLTERNCFRKPAQLGLNTLYIVLRSTSGLISMTVLCSTIIAVASKSKLEKERNVLRMALREDMKGSGRS